jgi:hypothetical protein
MTTRSHCFPEQVREICASAREERSSVPDKANAMTLEHIKVWRFDDAPAELKVGCRSGKRPQWLALVPRSIKGSDLDEAIQARSEVESLFIHQTASGDVIYIGSGKPSGTLACSRYSHG